MKLEIHACGEQGPHVMCQCVRDKMLAAEKLAKAAHAVNVDMDLDDRSLNAARKGFVPSRAMRIERIKLFLKFQRSLSAYEELRGAK